MNNVVGLYEHNEASYKKIKKAFDSGEKVVGIVHATGTGKSYNALQLAYDNKNKKITYVVPSLGIIEHIKNIIKENKNLDLQEDFKHVEFRTYQSFVNLSDQELQDLNIDMLILDEFHHLGAPVWGDRIERIINSHPDMQVFGMTAYTVRDRNTPYERDMAEINGNEIFSNKIVSTYSLCDAMIDGVLPKPIYKTAYINLEKTREELEKKVDKLDKNSKDYIECKNILEQIKKQIALSPSIKDLIKKNIRENGKYIYFCPPVSIDGKNDIESIKQEAFSWFKEYVDEKDIIFYTTTSDMGIEGKKNRDAFYEDKTLDGKSTKNKLMVMFAINQYNEGIHAPNVDGVILGRGTSSDIVFFEQLGRAQAVRGETNKRYKELNKFTKRDLIEICDKKDVLLPNGIYKEEIIEKLLSPVVIDLTNNIEYIKELENELKYRIKKINESKSHKKREIKIIDSNFDIEVENINIFEMLQYVFDRLTKTWEGYYELAKIYYENKSNLEIPDNFRTINGYEYDENGIKLGKWISQQRQLFKNGKLKEERKKLLEKLEMRLETKNYDEEWNKKYDLAKKYFKKYKKLDFSKAFLEKYNIDISEYLELKEWLKRQKINFNKGKLPKDKKQLLNELNFDYKIVDKKDLWEKNYKLATKYFEVHKDLEIPTDFKTINGYEYDENGIKLGLWVVNQRQRYMKNKLSEERIEKLSKIGMRFKSKSIDEEWEKNYKLAKAYYDKYNNLEIDWKFKTINGYEYDELGVKLGEWVHNQRRRYSKGVLKENEYKLLEDIKMRFETKNHEQEWKKYYEYAKKYYEENGHLNVKYNYILKVKFEDKINEIKLGSWIARQKKYYHEQELSKDKIKLLEEIGMDFNMRNNYDTWIEHYELAKTYYEYYKHLDMKTNFRTSDGYNFDVNGFNLGQWIHNQRTYYKTGALKKEKEDLLNSIGMIWDVKQNQEYILQFCDIYGISYEKNESILKNISYTTLLIKSKYIESKGLSISINGKLIEIFSMNNSEMKKSYGIDLMDMINEIEKEEEMKL